jgi:hypothetical protein
MKKNTINEELIRFTTSPLIELTETIFFASYFSRVMEKKKMFYSYKEIITLHSYITLSKLLIDIYSMAGVLYTPEFRVLENHPLNVVPNTNWTDEKLIADQKQLIFLKSHFDIITADLIIFLGITNDSFENDKIKPKFLFDYLDFEQKERIRLNTNSMTLVDVITSHEQLYNRFSMTISDSLLRKYNINPYLTDQNQFLLQNCETTTRAKRLAFFLMKDITRYFKK